MGSQPEKGVKRHWFLLTGTVFYGVVAAASSIGAAALPAWLGFKLYPVSSTAWAYSTATGLLAGVAMIAVSWVLVRRTKSGHRLADKLAVAVRGIPMPDAIVVAVLAGVSEELLFRGCMWSLVQSLGGTWVALASTSLLFSAVHGAFRRGYGLWGLFALAGGLVAGVLLILTGNLLAPIAMHVLTDAVNLPLLVRHARPCDDR